MYKMRIVIASALFDGHDVAINIFRRLFQKKGLEVIHIGHNRSVRQIVKTAIQEDADAVCVSSYQGGHMEFFKYLKDELNNADAPHIAIFGGGGGIILPNEIKELESYGITRIYHADDGRKLGLRGIVKDVISKIKKQHKKLEFKPVLSDYDIAKNITYIEKKGLPSNFKKSKKEIPVIGFTGPGGAGKSSLIDELILRRRIASPDLKIALLCFDPTKKLTGGAFLGDRIRMNSIYHPNIFLRSIATVELEVSKSANDIIQFLKTTDFDLIMIESTGIGQKDSGIVDISDTSVYVMTCEYGSTTQLEKIEMLDLADYIVVNKFDKMGSEDALKDVSTLTEKKTFGTTASDYNNPGVTRFFSELFNLPPIAQDKNQKKSGEFTILPPEKTFYLTEIAQAVKEYKKKSNELANLASILYRKSDQSNSEIEKILEDYHSKKQSYKKEEFNYKVRGKNIKQKLFTKTLSNTFIPKIATPTYRDWGDIISFMRRENFPGFFPYTAGVFPLKNMQEEPRRQFAGEGSPKRTNKRFHYLTDNDVYKRLSTAFDPVTLYGEDPSNRRDVYGKIGTSGVSVSTLDDMRELYAGFDLNDPKTSVSLTINGPAPIILAMFFNVAIEKGGSLKSIRGTVQADILKEEQAQNSCIFSSKFALKMLGDMQEYFIENDIRNFYSVSVSGYHIAEAGANPITQLALTLANGFTMVEYYLARGMKIDEFAPNLSFFFSSGLDPEYSVIGRVARRIWAIVMREKYRANDRSCKLKYHVQTSGRSLHASDIAFNDVRTTIQAMGAILDNCNSLHTNAYDEAITTPTLESLRRAMAIQLILMKEAGINSCENILQGSFFYEELTNLVEEAVLSEFESISRRGGVFGAMELQYQRNLIQAESMKYEMLKSVGEIPIVGVNTFTSKDGALDFKNVEPVRSSKKERDEQIQKRYAFIKKAGQKNEQALKKLQDVALSGGNIFAELMETVKYASLGQISEILRKSGGEYRRSM